MGDEKQCPVCQQWIKKKSRYCPYCTTVAIVFSVFVFVAIFFAIWWTH